MPKAPKYAAAEMQRLPWLTHGSQSPYSLMGVNGTSLGSSARTQGTANDSFAKTHTRPRCMSRFAGPVDSGSLGVGAGRPVQVATAQGGGGGLQSRGTCVEFL